MQGFLLCENGKEIEITDEGRLFKALKKNKVAIVIDLAEGAILSLDVRPHGRIYQN